MADSPVATNGTARVNLFSELGTTGLPQWGGVIRDEWLPEFTGIFRLRATREMVDHEPIIAASLLVYELLIRSVTRGVQPATDDNLGKEYADFIEGALYKDMAHTFSDFLSEAVQSMLAWGVSIHEPVLKIRGGDVQDPQRASLYQDFKYGWQKWPIRAYETLASWTFGPHNKLLGFTQFDQTAEPPIMSIPVDKLHLFRMRQHKGSPEGAPLIRPCFKPWYSKKHLEISQNIGFARNLTGIPIVWVPPNLLAQQPTPSDLALRQLFQGLAQGLERDQIRSLLFPLLFDEQGNKVYDLTFMGTGGASNAPMTQALGSAIQQYNLEMLLALMTAVILIGHEKVGNQALHVSSSQLMSYGLTAVLDGIYEVINKEAIPNLWRRNQFPREYMPTATHEDVESVALDELGNFILRLSQAGFDVRDLEAEIRRRAGFPMPQTDQVVA